MRIGRGCPAVRCALALVLGCVVLLASGCTLAISGQPVNRSSGTPTVGPGVPLATVSGATDSAADKLAVVAVSEVLAYWRRTFPEITGQPWTELQGGFFAVDTRKAGTAAPPCASSVKEVEGQAFYCPLGDLVAWDSGQLIPALQRRFGDAAVVVVLAHEIGHSIQKRLGLDDAQRREPQRYPTVLLEVMADCFAGAAIHDLADRGSLGLGDDRQQLDDALRALITFRDPVGAAAGDPGAHGNAFDRVSAFQDGYRQKAGLCAAMTVDNRVFTQTRFGSAADAASGGNLPLPDLLTALSTDARQRFTEFASAMGGSYPAPPLTDATRSTCPTSDTERQGPVRYCPDDRSISVDSAALARLHEIGDYASGTLIASRYALGALAALNKPIEGGGVGGRTLCLTGAYTAQLFNAPADAQFRLSPGDLDEAVNVLLVSDIAARDVRGQASGDAFGFERVEQFRVGALDGVGACQL